MKRTLFFLYIFTHTLTFCQNKRVVFSGKILDNLGILENIHIINLNTQEATYTNQQGKFKLFAKVNDSIKITSIGYKTQILILEPSDFGITKKQIHLKKEVIELDEVKLKKHNLSGNLASDLKQIPKENPYLKSNNAFDFSKFNFSEKVISHIDEIEKSKNIDALKITDPTRKLKGITIFSSSIFTSKKEKLLKERLIREEQRNGLPKKIINRIGEKAFTTEFKIPQDKIRQFLEYCGYEQLSKLSNSEKIFELINFLNTKSKSYLKLVNQNQ